MAQTNAPFNVVETTIDDIHGAYKSGQLSCRQLVQIYLDRIEAFDKKGPRINAIITLNADALKEADRLDAACARALALGTRSYSSVAAILKNAQERKQSHPEHPSLFHENIRGPGYYH